MGGIEQDGFDVQARINLEKQLTHCTNYTAMPFMLSV